jgi:hypothetical protein
LSDLKNISQFPGKRNKMGFSFILREREKAKGDAQEENITRGEIIGY